MGKLLYTLFVIAVYIATLNEAIAICLFAISPPRTFAQRRDSLKRRITLENKVETENLTHTFEVSY